MPCSEYIISTEVEPIETRHGFDLWWSQRQEDKPCDEHQCNKRIKAALAEATKLLKDESWCRRPKKHDFVKLLLTLLGSPNDLRMFVNSTYSTADGRFVDRRVQEYVLGLWR